MNVAMDSHIAKSVLNIGIDYKSAKGGIPDVERYHSQFMHPYRFVATSADGSRIRKLSFAMWGLLKFTLMLLTRPTIKIVHVHGCSDNSFWRKRMFVNVAHALGRKIVYHMHGGGFKDFSLNNKPQVQEMLDKVDVLAVLSDSWQQFFTENFNAKAIEVLPNGITAPTQFAPAPTKGPVRMLFLGMINANKGIYDIIDAVAANREHYSGRLKIEICGIGEVDNMLARAKELGVDNVIEYGGWVSGEEKARRLAQCDAFLLPSHFEGMPVCILEAMSYGKPILATRVGGIPDIVLNGANGLLIPAGNPQALTRAIDYIVDNPQIRQKMGAASLSRIAYHLPDRIASKLEEIYKSLLS